MTDKLAAPESIIELSLCKCKGDCSTLRCGCRKNQLQCTEMCLCCDCSNRSINESLLENDNNENTSS